MKLDLGNIEGFSAGFNVTLWAWNNQEYWRQSANLSVYATDSITNSTLCSRNVSPSGPGAAVTVVCPPGSYRYVVVERQLSAPDVLALQEAVITRFSESAALRFLHYRYTKSSLMRMHSACTSLQVRRATALSRPPRRLQCPLWPALT